MLYYLKHDPEDHNYGNPHSNKKEGDILLPVELLADYLATKGFARLTIVNDVITAVAIDQEAYDAYMADHPDVPDPEEPPTDGEILDALLGVE